MIEPTNLPARQDRLIPQEQQVRDEFLAKLQRKLTSRRMLLGVGALGVLAALLPLAIAALQAGLALAAIGVLALLGLAAWTMLPRWVLTLENREREKTQVEMNRHLAALKAEASRNPIEQAENEYLRRSEQYQVFKAAMEQIGGQVQSFKSKLLRTKKERPNYDLTAETEALARMEEFYANRTARLSQAVVALGQFKDKIDEARVKWSFQLDANAAIRAMNATDRDAKINVILSEVAFDSVQREFDSVFARLDVDAAELRGQKALEFGQGVSLDVSGAPEPVPVARATDQV